MSGYEVPCSSTAPTDKNQPRVRLHYLDGLRGLAALYVVVFHIYLDVNEQLRGADTPHLVRIVIRLLSQGKASVAVFIVLSGYCLMLPVARSGNGQLKGGLLNYLKRRAWRIMPAYYAALLLSVLLNLLIPVGLMPDTGDTWRLGQPAFTPGALLSHLLLLHNLNPDWSHKINPPMWSVALEWQIYFLFPILLLPVWRRFGVISAVAIACIVALALYQVDSSYYVILFTLGMVGAVIGFSRELSLKMWKDKVRWDMLAGVLLVIWITTVPLLPRHSSVTDCISGLLIGTAITCLIISCTQFLTEAKKTRFRGLLRLLESRWTVALGTFSYSLYLTHAPVLALTELYLSNLHLSPIAKLLALMTLALPLSVLTAYVFYLIFEKRFMSSTVRRQ